MKKIKIIFAVIISLVFEMRIFKFFAIMNILILFNLILITIAPNLGIVLKIFMGTIDIAFLAVLTVFILESRKVFLNYFRDIFMQIEKGIKPFKRNHMNAFIA